MPAAGNPGTAAQSVLRFLYPAGAAPLFCCKLGTMAAVKKSNLKVACEIAAGAVLLFGINHFWVHRPWSELRDCIVALAVVVIISRIVRPWMDRQEREATVRLAQTQRQPKGRGFPVKLVGRGKAEPMPPDATPAGHHTQENE